MHRDAGRVCIPHGLARRRRAGAGVLMALSRQRALIALRSFPSVRAAARSVGVAPITLTRFARTDGELREALEQCIRGIVRARASAEKAEEKQARKAEFPRDPVRAAECRKAIVLASYGRDPMLANGMLHARMNRQARQEKAADMEDALDGLADVHAAAKLARPPTAAHNPEDRWCLRCKTERADDPCEVCGRHTVRAAP